MEKIFLTLHRFLKKRKTPFFVIFILFTALLAWLATSINLKEDVSDFMPDDSETGRISFVNNNISLSEKIIISLSNSDTSLFAYDGDLFSLADMLADSIMSKGAGMTDNIFYRVNDEQTMSVGSFMLSNMPFYLSDADYARIDSALSPERIKKAIESDRRIIVSPAGYAIKKMITIDPLHLSTNVLNRLTSYQVDKVYNINNGYILSRDSRKLFIFVSSVYPVSETAKNKELISVLNSCLDDVKSVSGNTINISVFGAVDVAVTNATQIRRDSYLSIMISVCLILILLGLYFRKAAPLYLIVFPVLFGGVFAVALLFVFKGTISSIAIGAGSAIFGIALNYSLHFFVHLRGHGGVESTISDLALPMITGSITTVGAFLSLMILSSEALHDFGLFAALTLLGSMLFVLIVLPLMPGLGRIAPSQEKDQGPSLWDRLSEFRPENKKYLVLVTVVLTLILSFFSGSVRFDSDLNQINYMTDDQRESFRELSEFTTLTRSTTYLITEGKDPYSALRNYERNSVIIDSLVSCGAIEGYMGIGTGLLSDSLQKIQAEKWNSFWQSRKSQVIESVNKYSRESGFSEESFSSFTSLIDSAVTPQPYDHFSTLTESVFRDLLINKEGRSMIVTPIYTNPAKPFDPQIITSRYPDTFVYDRKNIADGLVTSLVNDFNKVLWICGLIVILFLTISFGRLELSLIAFAPMAVSWLWILGIMSIFNISFNVVNVILATFIFGLGDDYSIFITEGLMKDYSHRTKMLKSYKTAVLLSALTMFIGIGTLVFAKHPAMKSLAIVTIIGMTSVVIISFITAPYLFNALIRKKGSYRLIPVTLRNFVTTVYSFTFFLAGSVFLTVSGYVLLRLQKPTRRNKLRFHSHLTRISRYVVSHIPGVKTEVINTPGEDFSKPAVIICNHQAHIDLAFMMMLSPRIIILTNEWVWNSPFYGKIVKFADFYPVADGIETSIDRLSGLVAEGYSIMVFPEGTRSEDCSIRRFHKGAFYLAERLNIDIVPVVIHGMGHCLPKKELLLRKGRCTVKIFDRVSPADKSFGDDYVARSKSFRKFYLSEYNTLAGQTETPEYFRDKVIHNYIYKGLETELAARRILNNRSSDKLIALLPDNGRVLFAGSGNGELTLLAALVKKELLIDATESNDEMRALADNCISRPGNLRYLSSVEGSSEVYDAVIWQVRDEKSVSGAIEHYHSHPTLYGKMLVVIPQGAMHTNKRGITAAGKEEVVKFAAASGYGIRDDEDLIIMDK